MQRHEGGYFIRLSLQNRIGAFAAIAARMAEREISLESIMQRHLPGPDVKGPMPVTLITYATTETKVREALDAVERDGFIAGKPQVVRIERE